MSYFVYKGMGIKYRMLNMIVMINRQTILMNNTKISYIANIISLYCGTFKINDSMLISPFSVLLHFYFQHL